MKKEIPLFKTPIEQIKASIRALKWLNTDPRANTPANELMGKGLPKKKVLIDFSAPFVPGEDLGPMRDD